MNDGSMQPYALTLDKFLRHAAKWHPRAEVVTATEHGPPTRVGYAELMARARRASRVLTELGIKQGDRIATIAWNTQAHVEAWYAIIGMGAVCHTLNPRLLPAQLAAMLVQSDARVLIASADLAPLVGRILEDAPAIAEVLVIDGHAEAMRTCAPGRSVTALSSLLAEADEAFEWGAFDETLASGLCFTSGTTGAPKGVTYTHRSSYLHTLRALQADVIGLTASDAVLTVVPMFHANAWGLPFAAPAVGAKLVLPGRHADGASLAALINLEQVTVAVGVPTVWIGLLDHIEATDGAVPSLKRILVGGAPLPRALMERLERRLEVTIQTSWGMTELSPIGTMSLPGAAERDPSLSGKPSVGIDLLLTDSAGAPLPEQRNAEGNLHVRGPAVVERYFGQAEPATRDGWFDTGDLARIDEAGNLRITGRAKDLIKSGGEWINPSEIEAVVGALPQVSMVAVIGRVDEKWGERPILLVETRKDETISDEALLAPLHGRVAPWWIPDAVVRISNMPLASTGKIDKIRLRSEYSHP